MSISHAVGAPRAVHGMHRSWQAARQLAHTEGERIAYRVSPDVVPVAEARDRTLAHDLFALTDLPRTSASAMDGWAVSGDGPWEVGEPIRAGDLTPRAPLEEGHARAISTGAPVPPGTHAVLRSEDGDARYSNGTIRLHLAPSVRAPDAGRDIRLAGEEARRGEPILVAGTTMTAPRLALAAVAGFDEITVTGRPAVDLVLFGDELRTSGVPGDGEIRDAFLPALPSAIFGSGGVHAGTRFGRDSLDSTVSALMSTDSPVVVSTGGTARGPADFVRSALDTIGARTVCDGIAMRPGHPVIIAQLHGDRLFLGLPGNPLAAMLAFASLATPLLGGMTGRRLVSAPLVRLAVAVANRSSSTRLVPCTLDEHGATPTPWQGTAMLRGLAAADVVAVVPAGGAEAGTAVGTVPVPW
jgi:molybdopterin molybdotransferase